MGTIEILKNVSAVLLLLTGVCFCYQTVYLAVSLFWKEPPSRENQKAFMATARSRDTSSCGKLSEIIMKALAYI